LHIFGDSLSLGTGNFLLLALGLALSFEFVNGFHEGGRHPLPRGGSPQQGSGGEPSI
jgi:hypothetical protein